MDNKKEFINNLTSRYMWIYPLVLNILFLPFYQSYQSFFIALGCLFALVRKMQSLDFKLQNHIVLLNIKSAWADKKVFLIRIVVSWLAVMEIWMCFISESSTWVCGAFCLNSEILEKIFRGFGYSGSLYFLFILMIDLNKLRESI